MPTFTARLRAARKMRGLTQTALGEMLSLSKQAVAAWEQGRNQPNAAQLALLCECLKVDANYLVLGVHNAISQDAARIAVAYDASSDEAKALLRRVFAQPADDNKVERAYGKAPPLPGITKGSKS